MQRLGQHRRLRLIVTGLGAAIVGFALVVGIGVGLTPGRTSGYPGTPQALSATERAQRFQPGNAWTGQGRQGISQAEAERFADYPLFWLGDRYAGFHLRAIHHEQFRPPPGVPDRYAREGVSFSYGDCTIPEGYSACPIPLVVSIEPGCRVRPEMIAETARAGRLETVRGAALQLRFRDGHVRLWTGAVSITVDAPADPALIDQMVQDLHGMGRNRSIAAAPLAAPDFSGCPPVELPPLEQPPVGR